MNISNMNICNFAEFMNEIPNGDGNSRHINQSLAPYRPSSNKFSTSQEKNAIVLKCVVSLLSSARSVTQLAEPINPSSGSMLNHFFSQAGRNDENSNHSPVFSLPSLRLKKSDSTCGFTKSSNLSPKQAAALMMAVPVEIGLDAIEALPNAIIDDVSESILSLIDSRLRLSTSALLKRSFNRRSSLSSETSMLIHMLRNSPLSLKTIVTSFRVVDIDLDLNNSFDSDIILLPVVFESVVDISILGQLTTFSFQAPGTATGSFFPHDSIMRAVDIKFDTLTLLQDMMKQTRRIVRKTVARCVNISRILSKEPLLENLAYSNLTENKRKICHDTEKKEEPYQLFAWLAGDEMMLKEDDMYPKKSLPSTSSLKSQLTYGGGNSSQHLYPPSKRKRVSFHSS